MSLLWDSVFKSSKCFVSFFYGALKSHSYYPPHPTADVFNHSCEICWVSKQGGETLCIVFNAVIKKCIFKMSLTCVKKYICIEKQHRWALSKISWYILGNNENKWVLAYVCTNCAIQKIRIAQSLFLQLVVPVVFCKEGSLFLAVKWKYIQSQRQKHIFLGLCSRDCLNLLAVGGSWLWTNQLVAVLCAVWLCQSCCFSNPYFLCTG